MGIHLSIRGSNLPKKMVQFSFTILHLNADYGQVYVCARACVFLASTLILFHTLPSTVYTAINVLTGRRNLDKLTVFHRRFNLFKTVIRKG